MSKEATLKKGKEAEATKADAPAPIAEKSSSAMALAADFAADAGKGMEGTDKDSFAVPFLTMLQGLSPAVAEGLVDGAKAGLMMNTVSNELFVTAKVVPVAFKRSYLRWKPRNEGGGFKGELSVAQVEQMIREGKAKDELDDRGVKQLKDDEGCELRDTRVHFCLLLTDGGPRPVIVSMARTQIKRSKRWMTRINDIVMTGPDNRRFTPPSFSHVYALKSEKESNDEGTWFSFSVDLERPLNVVESEDDRHVYESAKKFHEQITAGKVKVQHDQAEEASGGESKGF